MTLTMVSFHFFGRFYDTLEFMGHYWNALEF